MFQDEGERKIEHLGPDYLLKYIHILILTHTIYLLFVTDRGIINKLKWNQ